MPRHLVQHAHAMRHSVGPVAHVPFALRSLTRMRARIAAQSCQFARRVHVICFGRRWLTVVDPRHWRSQRYKFTAHADQALAGQLGWVQLVAVPWHLCQLFHDRYDNIRRHFEHSSTLAVLQVNFGDGMDVESRCSVRCAFAASANSPTSQAGWCSRAGSGRGAGAAAPASARDRARQAPEG